MFRKHRFAVLGVAVLSLSMLLAVAAETLLWVAEGDDFYGRSFERRYIRLKENRPGQELVDVPDEAYLAARDSLEPRGFAWGTDADGFLLPSPSHERADYSIVFLGGSSTECRFVTEDKRFPYLAGRLLEDRLGWTVNAYNGGVRGNNSLHSINIFLNKVLPLKPDVVVLMHNINDLGILLHEGAYWNRHPTRSPLVSLIEQEGEPKRTLWRRTRDVLHALLPRLYVRAVRLKGRLAGAGPVTDEWGHLRDEKIDYDAEALRASFRTNLILFVEIARATGVEPVLMAQANRIIDDPDPAVRVNLANVEQEGLGYPAFKKLYDRFNDIIREVGEQRGVQVIDLERAMPKERRFLYDSVHFNDAGSELAASVIAEQLSHRFQPEP